MTSSQMRSRRGRRRRSSRTTIARGKGDGAAAARGRPAARRSRPSARAARVRSNARIVAVTGSAGKTGTKEMLRLCLAEAGATHASEKSYNNHWGVPLTLARMPRAAALRRVRDRHEPCRRDRAAGAPGAAARGGHHHGRAGAPGVLPIGRGHRRGEGGDLPGPGAGRHRRAAARQPALSAAQASAPPPSAPRSSASATPRPPTCAASRPTLRRQRAPPSIAGVGAQRFPYRVGAPGEHYVKNSLAVLAALMALGADAMRCLPALVRVAAPAGPGRATDARRRRAAASC